MRKLLAIFLLIAGSSLWATEGEWTYQEDGSYLIKYDSSSTVWSAFQEMADGCYFVYEETQIPVRFGARQYYIEVMMFTQKTIIHLIEDGYLSIFVVLKD